MNQVGEKINFEAKAKECRTLNPQELMQLLRGSMGINVFFSWGASKFIVDNMKNPRMFRMNVQGHHHKGHVYIFVNGSDLFDVYLTSNQGTIKKFVEDLYFDQLVEWIDDNIERIPEYED
jgi:hypothetical protein